MRKHGWELPYHPLQVVAIAVFLALTFAFYVFFVPFVGGRVFQYSLVALFSFLVTASFTLYVYCAACDPADPAVLRSKKYIKSGQVGRVSSFDDSVSKPALVNDTTSLSTKAQANESVVTIQSAKQSKDEIKQGCCSKAFCAVFAVCAYIPFIQSLKGSCLDKPPSEQHSCDDDQLYCSLCEVEISKHSKHCRVCDKCVDGFDHHCRWLNNCIGRGNYREFFALMIYALLLLVLQWTVGIFVIIRCFLHRHQFEEEIVSRLGSGFSIGPFVVVVGCCTILAMIATLPLGQLFFFHILLVNKGISTYDYIVAMREQDQQTMGDGAQSPQMSHVSSISAFSASSSFAALHLNHGSWCTPPRLFMDDQFDVVPTEQTLSAIKIGTAPGFTRKSVDRTIKKNNVPVKISPWALARMNSEEVSRVASQARKNSKVLRKISEQEGIPGIETDSSLESSSRDLSTEIRKVHENPKQIIMHDKQLRPIKPGQFSKSLKPPRISAENAGGSSYDGSKSLLNVNRKLMDAYAPLTPLQIEARNAFKSSHAMSMEGAIASSAESSLACPDVKKLRASMSGIKDVSLVPLPPTSIAEESKFDRSTSDGYDASGGESADDSDQNSARLHKFPYLDQNKVIRHIMPYPTSQMPYGMADLNSVGKGRLTIEANAGKDMRGEALVSSHHHYDNPTSSVSLPEKLLETSSVYSQGKKVAVHHSIEEGFSIFHKK